MQELLHAFDCPLCGEMLKRPVTTVDCLHTFCYQCLDTHLYSTQSLCPICSRPQTMGLTTREHVTLNALHSHALVLQNLLLGSSMNEDALQKQVSLQTTTNENALQVSLQTTLNEEEEEESTPVDTQRLMEERKKLTKQQERVNIVPPLPNRKVVLSSALSAEVKQLAKNTLSSEQFYSPNNSKVPTHLIVHATWDEQLGEWLCAPTYKYYWALSLGVWIVRDGWLTKCDVKNSEVEYQVRSTTCTFALSPANHEPLNLFTGLEFQLGPFSLENTLRKQHAKELIELNGGKVVDLMGEADGTKMLTPPPNHANNAVLVGHPIHFTHANNQCSFCSNILSTIGEQMKLVESAWIIQCLSNKQVVEFGDRVLTA